MAWPHLSGIVKCVCTFEYGISRAVNVHYVSKRGGGSPISVADLEDVAEIFQDAIFTEFIAFIGNDWTLETVVATDWSAENGGQFDLDTGVPVAGTETTEEVPHSIALVASHRTAQTGRSFRGRSYQPGLTEGHIHGAYVDGATATALGDVYDYLRVELDLIGYDHVVYSLYSGGVARTTPVATPVTRTVVNLRVDTQRLRLPS